MQTLAIVNESSRELPDGWLLHARDALQQGMSHIACMWSQQVWTIVDELRGQGYYIALVDSLPEAEGALAYHDVDDDGAPYIRVGLDAIFNNGGDWYTGVLSVISVIDHETKEVCGDPACNVWCNDAYGVNWARELCDATQNFTYDVECADGTTCSLSNFVVPAYFNPLAPIGTQLDWMNLVARPFDILPGGYAIRQSPGEIGQAYGIAQVFHPKAGKRPAEMLHRAYEYASWTGAKVVSMEMEAE